MSYVTYNIFTNRKEDLSFELLAINVNFFECEPGFFLHADFSIKQVSDVKGHDRVFTG